MCRWLHALLHPRLDPWLGTRLGAQFRARLCRYRGFRARLGQGLRLDARHLLRHLRWRRRQIGPGLHRRRLRARLRSTELRLRGRLNRRGQDVGPGWGLGCGFRLNLFLGGFGCYDGLGLRQFHDKRLLLRHARLEPRKEPQRQGMKHQRDDERNQHRLVPVPLVSKSTLERQFSGGCSRHGRVFSRAARLGESPWERQRYSPNS